MSFELIITAIIIGITAWTFTILLMDKDMIFGWWYNVIDRLPEYFAKPLGKCEYCLAGQIALWLYLIKHFNNYDPIDHIFFISIAIFTIELIIITIYGKK